MDLIYPCKCKGECAPYIELAACIMKTDKEDSYCQWCRYSLKEMTRLLHDDIA